jgi:hypothetical protein
MPKYIAAVSIIPAAFAFAFAGSFTPETPVVEPGAYDVAVQPAVRVQLDLARGRRWELRWDAVSVHDIASGELVRRIPLPGAAFSASRDSCLPDMLLSRSGALIVSSNVHPRLWRVSPARFEVEVYDIAVNGDEGKEFGFTSLAWGNSERTLFARSAPGGTQWRIDPVAGGAVKVGSAPTRLSCGGSTGLPTS